MSDEHKMSPIELQTRQCLGEFSEQTVDIRDTIQVHVGKPCTSTPLRVSLQYGNDQLTIYDEDELHDPTEWDSDWIQDWLESLDPQWRDNYYTKFRDEDVKVSPAVLISPERLATHRDGSAPLTIGELEKYRVVRTQVTLRPRKEPRLSKQDKKRKRLADSVSNSKIVKKQKRETVPKFIQSEKGCINLSGMNRAERVAMHQFFQNY